MDKKRDTLICHAGLDPENNHGIVNPPVYHASTITFPTVERFESSTNPKLRIPHYGRTGTPTTFAFEDAITALHKGYGTVACPSGLGAVTGAMLTVLQAGDHVLVVDTAYEPTRKRLCEFLLKRSGIDSTFYDPAIGAGITEMFQPNTKAVFLESPGSITFEMQDVPAMADVCRKSGVRTIIDNTWSSPLLFQPLDHGVDFVVEASTKYVVGHSDAMLGTITVANEADYIAVKTMANSLGFSAAPDDCYLGQRGLRTLSVRLERHQKNALKVAEWLQSQNVVEKVLYPALPDDPGYALWRRDHSGASGLFGVVLTPGPKSAVEAMLDGLELHGIGASWGGYESLALATYPAPLRTATEWPYEGPCIRLHIGLEDPDDLIADLKAGLDRFAAAR